MDKKGQSEARFADLLNTGEHVEKSRNVQGGGLAGVVCAIIPTTAAGLNRRSVAVDMGTWTSGRKAGIAGATAMW